MRLKSLLKKCFLRPAVPQRLEAAIDSVAVTARVELVPFPFVEGSRVFQQSVKPDPFKTILACREIYGTPHYFE
ncbi:MAG: hypothetical protein WBQ39_07600 [Terriglobales bacterium]